MKKTIAIILLLISSNVFSQIPSNYYNSATGMTGYSLKSKLSTIISNGHINHSYGSLYTGYQTTDTDNYFENDGTILDMYSENPNGPDSYSYTHNNNKCGSYSSESDCYNREHLMPQSWFSKRSPMKNDIHHVVPSDGKVNGERGNYPLADVSNASWTSQNGSKLGPCGNSGYNGTVFEPIDEFKGDIARIYFYMATRYENKIGSWENSNSSSDAVLDGSSNQVYEDWYLAVLLQWHNQDPVSQREIDRNNAAYNYQGNANPFISNPEWVTIIWDPSGGPQPSSYCSSKGNSVSDEYIQRVQIGTINNPSGAANGYSDHTDISTNLAKGTSATITITPKWTGTVYSEGYAVWIDYNQDGDFTDSGEKVLSKSTSKTTPVNGTFTVPSNAITGNTRMRVSMKYNGIPTSCESFNYGEVEDYTVNISNGGGAGGTCINTALTINFDNYPAETSWEVKNNSGAVVLSGGTYGSQAKRSTLSTSNCLPVGCYTFTMKDTYGDGMCCNYGNGSYSLTENGNTLASGASFTHTNTTNFCVGSANRASDNNAKLKELTIDALIYPNPVKNYITINLRDAKMKNYRITNMLGQNILQGSISDIKIDVSMLEKGVYFITFSSNKKQITKRIIKK